MTDVVVTIPEVPLGGMAGRRRPSRHAVEWPREPLLLWRRAAEHPTG
jgi:hypothetical protein